MRYSRSIITKWIMAAGVLLLMLLLLPNKAVYATTATPTPTPSPVQIAGVEYYYENVAVFNNGNNKIYYATEVEAAKNNWEVIPADAGDFTVIDMSWLSPTVENIIKIKGDLNQTQTRFIMRAKPKKLEVAINYEGLDKLAMKNSIGPLINIMTSEGNGSNPITFEDLEWKKGETGRWASCNTLNRSKIEKFLVKGTYLYFRIRAINDYVDISDDGASINLNNLITFGLYEDISTYVGTAVAYGTNYPDGLGGRRFSSEVKLKIAKKASPMVYGIDGEEFTAEIKYGKEYRVTTEVAGTDVTTNWIKVTDKSVKSLALKEILNSTTYDGSTALKSFPAMTIEIRDYATTRAAASKITTIQLEPQRKLNGAITLGKAPTVASSADENIYMSYNGTKNINITIPSASPDLPYEYCVIKPNDEFDFKYAVWTAITKGTEVKVLASKAVQDGELYIRQKEIKSKEATRTTAAVGYELASTYLTQKINYPSNPAVQKATVTYTKKYTTNTPITFTITLNEKGKLPFETQIKNIKLGTKEILFTSSTTTNADNVSTMTVVLTSSSLEAMTNCTNKPLTITFTNGTIDKTSLKLTIQNATPAGTLNATPGKGTAAGTTAITLTSTPGTDNKLVYKIGNAVVNNVTMEDTMTTGSTFVSGADISINFPTDQYVTVYEIDASNKIIKYKSILISSNEIGPKN